MRRSQDQNRGQLVLALERRDLPLPVEQGTQGLVEAPAELLLAAPERDETTSTSKRGDGDQQDHR